MVSGGSTLEQGCCSTPDFGWLGIPSSAWTKFLWQSCIVIIIIIMLLLQYWVVRIHSWIVIICRLKLKTSHLFSPLFFRLVKCLPVGDRKASLVASSLQLPQGLGIMATRFLTPKPPLRMAVIGTIKLFFKMKIRNRLQTPTYSPLECETAAGPGWLTFNSKGDKLSAAWSTCASVNI